MVGHQPEALRSLESQWQVEARWDQPCTDGPQPWPVFDTYPPGERHRHDGGARGCAPLAGAVVDLWHCDARGYYSGVQDRSFSTTGKRFLRGYQVTDSAGTAKFSTIYPGWYPGRTVHIHFKIRTDPASKAGHAFTSQLYFDDSLTDHVYTLPPYSSRGRRMLRNEEDFIFRTGGKQLMLVLDKNGPGYTSTFDIGLQLQPGSS